MGPVKNFTSSAYNASTLLFWRQKGHYAAAPGGTDLSIMTLGLMDTLCSSDEMPSRIGVNWLAGRFLLKRLNDFESNASGMMYSFCVINLAVVQQQTDVSNDPQSDRHHAKYNLNNS